MNRRSILRALPLAALAGATVKLEGVEAKAYELESRKKYVFVLPNEVAQGVEVEEFAQRLRGRGIDATVVANAEDLKIYELQ